MWLFKQNIYKARREDILIYCVNWTAQNNSNIKMSTVGYIDFTDTLAGRTVMPGPASVGTITGYIIDGVGTFACSIPMTFTTFKAEWNTDTLPVVTDKVLTSLIYTVEVVFSDASEHSIINGQTNAIVIPGQLDSSYNNCTIPPVYSYYEAEYNECSGTTCIGLPTPLWIYDVNNALVLDKYYHFDNGSLNRSFKILSGPKTYAEYVTAGSPLAMETAFGITYFNTCTCLTSIPETTPNYRVTDCETSFDYNFYSESVFIIGDVVQYLWDSDGGAIIHCGTIVDIGYESIADATLYSVVETSCDNASKCGIPNPDYILP